MKKLVLMITSLGLLVMGSCQTHAVPYQADWASLAKHNEAPEWFQDAKLGIYFHWGVYSVPAYGSEWYPRLMHIKGHPVQLHHLEKYGHPSEFGYHDFVPLFKAEHFNAEEWADLFVKAGARFAGPVAEHHDGFSMWASKQTPWNVGDKGPKRDILGELAKAFRNRDLKLITTFHHARNLQRYADSAKVAEELKIKNPNQQFRNSHYPFLKEYPTTSNDPELRQLYGNMPEQQWLDQMWFGKLKEVVDNYQPDIVWFDSWLDQIPENYRKKFCAYYLNRAAEWGKEVVIVRKQDDLPLDVSVDDLEKSRKNRLEEKPWMTDETISTGSWCYTENLRIKPAKDVLHVLIDIVSKNGVLLLNVSPKADGTIPNDQQDVLLKMGAWLEKYGEAIYDTRPWYTFGEGPTKEPEGHFKNHREFLKIKYSAKDIRYTTKGNIIYAAFLGAPAAGPVTLKSFAAEQLPKALQIESVQLLGSDTTLAWQLAEEGLVVSIPNADLDDMAVVLKIVTKA